MLCKNEHSDPYFLLHFSNITWLPTRWSLRIFLILLIFKWNHLKELNKLYLVLRPSHWAGKYTEIICLSIQTTDISVLRCHWHWVVGIYQVDWGHEANCFLLIVEHRTDSPFLKCLHSIDSFNLLGLRIILYQPFFFFLRNTLEITWFSEGRASSITPFCKMS